MGGHLTVLKQNDTIGDRTTTDLPISVARISAAAVLESVETGKVNVTE